MAKYDKNKLGKITGKYITEATSKKGTKAGEFTEAAGGGSPIEAGEKFKLVDSSKEAEEYRENHPGAKVRVMQPRDDDGKFTYNSANLRDRKHEYHGKGKRDGSGESAEFPLMIDYDKLAEIFVTDNVMTADDAKRYISGITLTVEELKKAVKKFSEEEGAFAGGLGSDKAFVKKVGRKSKSEAETGLGRVDRAKLSEMTVKKLEEAGKAKTDIPNDEPHNAALERIKKWWGSGSGVGAQGYTPEQIADVVELLKGTELEMSAEEVKDMLDLGYLKIDELIEV